MSVNENSVVTLAEFCGIEGVPSEPTMRRIIDQHDDFPLVARGKNGVAYEIPLKAGIDWLKTFRAREEEDARRRRDDVRQLGLELLGVDAASSESEGLTAEEQRKLLEAEIVAIRVGRERGELVRAADVEAAAGQILNWFQQAVMTLSGRVAKKVDISREIRVEIDEQAADVLNELADQMEALKPSRAAAAGDRELSSSG